MAGKMDERMDGLLYCGCNWVGIKKICEVTELIYFDGWKEAKNVKLPPWSYDGMHVFWRYKCHSTHKYAHTEAHSHILKCRSVYLPGWH